MSCHVFFFLSIFLMLMHIGVMISLWSSNAMTEYHEKMIFFFSIFIRWSTIMWWITTSRGLPRSNVECKADSIFLLRLHAWCMYSLKLTSESILANWNHEPNSIFLFCFLPSGVCVCALFNLNLAADLAWNCAYSQCIHKFNSALASFCALRFFD